MAQPQFSLSWNAHSKNISHGMSSLQQNSEFVDMTLAADGHYVKVHQLVLAVASPYIKELISSTQCRHPVIFLNKISYPTLQALLEYIYMGEVVITQDNLSDLMEAAKELHIKGLEDMKVELQDDVGALVAKARQQQSIAKKVKYESKPFKINTEIEIEKCSDTAPNIQEVYIHDDNGNDTTMDTDPEDTADNTENTSIERPLTDTLPHKETRLQYTLSNQGSLQLILNRYIYILRYMSVRNVGQRTWRCVDYERGRRCPATAVTANDVVLKRFSAHNHSFHDKRIMKKLRDNGVFTAIKEAELEVKKVKGKKKSKSDKNDAETKEASS